MTYFILIHKKTLLHTIVSIYQEKMVDYFYVLILFSFSTCVGYVESKILYQGISRHFDKEFQHQHLIRIFFCKDSCHISWHLSRVFCYIFFYPYSLIIVCIFFAISSVSIYNFSISGEHYVLSKCNTI